MTVRDLCIVGKAGSLPDGERRYKWIHASSILKSRIAIIQQEKTGRKRRKNKNIFFFFCPHTLTFRLKRPVYRGFSGEGKCEGK